MSMRSSLQLQQYKWVECKRKKKKKKNEKGTMCKYYQNRAEESVLT